MFQPKWCCMIHSFSTLTQILLKAAIWQSTYHEVHIGRADPIHNVLAVIYHFQDLILVLTKVIVPDALTMQLPIKCFKKAAIWANGHKHLFSMLSF